MEGKKHDYLGMTLDYSIKGNLKVDMKQYVKDVVESFPGNLSEKIDSPWNTRLFNINDESQLLDKDKRETFHTFVIKCMFLAKRARPDTLVGITFLSRRVLRSNKEDWNKIVRIISHLKNTTGMVLCLEADDVQEIKWYVNASFGTHNDLKSHTGSIFTLGNGAIWNDSTKQKVNAKSSTVADLILSMIRY